MMLGNRSKTSTLLKKIVQNHSRLSLKTNLLFHSLYRFQTNVPSSPSSAVPTSEATSQKSAELCGKADSTETQRIRKLRNICISAHIDSGKTTLTERILYYTGRIKTMHEVRGKDGVGAKMDSMELEREKGITIKSAATFTFWDDIAINIVDTPGHVDFTIEVECSMRVLDGAVLVICGVSGVQSQSMTVSKQMNRYNVPRIAFVNKMDRQGANALWAVDSMKSKLKLRCALVQAPIGKEKDFLGVVDLLEMKAVYFESDDGAVVVQREIPKSELPLAQKLRAQLIVEIAEVDEKVEELYLAETEPTTEELRNAIRRATVQNKFVPVFLGSAIKNKGVQTLLDGVRDYLPSPLEVKNFGFDISSVDQSSTNSEQSEKSKVLLSLDSTAPLLLFSFKLEETSFGQLTWIRVYQGVLKKGTYIYELSGGNKNKKIRVGKIVKLHSDEYTEVDSVSAGEIAALFGIECNNSTSFGDLKQNLVVSGITVPEPVISLAVQLKNSQKAEKFNKALKRFQREDPTFRVATDEESGEILISGMGELHLEIYLERLRREYGVETITSKPRVNYRERITRRAEYNYLHKKQTGGAGQYARIIGYIEPIAPEEADYPFKFENCIKGLIIPPEFIQSIEKGFRFSMMKGPLIGAPVQGVRFVLEDGQSHEVDSSDWAFYQAAVGACRQVMKESGAVIFEPIMAVEVSFPVQFQGAVVGGLSKKGAMIEELQRREESGFIRANVSLESMFGYSTDLRGCTEGKGEFSMEYLRHEQVPGRKVQNLIKENK